MTSKPLKTVEEKTAHMVNSIKQDITVSVMGKHIDLPCSDLADGCIGVSLWFDTLENAVAYGEDGDHISHATYEPRKLSEHFNDNVLNSKEASTKGGER